MAPAVETEFTERYYADVVRRHDYRRFYMDRFDFELAQMSAEELEMRFLCHNGARDFATLPRGERIISTGFGMSGVPHAGTMSQIAKIVRLQRGGEACQIVLGDLDAHNGKQVPLSEARELAHRYAEFVVRCGFDAEAGVVRPQYGYGSGLSAMYLLANYVRSEDFKDAEEDLHGHYVDLGLIDATMTFRRQCSLALMAADFIDAGQSYDGVLVMLGIDEHKYVRFARDVAARFDEDTPLRKVDISAIYTRMIPGFDGHAKMSKSIPGSSLDVHSGPDDVAKRIRGDDVSDPDRSPAFQLAHQLFVGDLEETKSWREACALQNKAWTRAKERVIEVFLDMAGRW